MTRIAMLLAAGRGERLRPLTDDMPKALVPVNGVTLLERHLHRLSASGVTTVVINLGWHGEKIVERVGNGGRYGLRVVYSPEYEHVLDTGGGIQRALPLLGNAPFWVVNADVLTDWTQPETDLASDRLAHLVMVPNPAYRDEGDFSLQNGRVTNDGVRQLTFSGIAQYRPAFFDDCRPGRFALAPLLRTAAEQAVMSGEVYDGLWLDVGTPERLAAAEALVQKGESVE